MIVDKHTSDIDLDEIARAGIALAPAGPDYAYTTVRMGQVTLGVKVHAVEDEYRYLVYLPAFVPDLAELRRGFARFCYEQDDERFMDLALAERRGEVRSLHVVPRRTQNLVEGLNETLPFMAEAARALERYIAAGIRRARTQQGGR